MSNEFTFSLDANITGIAALKRSVKSISKRHIKFGWYEGKNYPASHPNRGLPIAQIAHWQEYGSTTGSGGNIPSRPYFRQTVNIVKFKYRNEIRSIFRTAIMGQNTANQLTLLSKEIETDYLGSVLRQNYKKLSSYTVTLKGHTFQMEDSGIMINNFKAKVYRTGIHTVK